MNIDTNDNGNITVELKTGLKNFLKNPDAGHNITMEIKENFRVIDVVILLGIPKEKIALITINKKTAGLDSELYSNDKVALYPPIGGG